MSRARFLTTAGILALPLLAGGFAWQARASADGARLFDEVFSLVSDRFVDTVGAAGLYERAARGLVRELQDPYSELLSPKQLSTFNRNTAGRYGGVGMQIEDQQGNITVSRVFPGTPAEAAGILEGDRIVQVDTSSTRGWKIQQVSDRLIGTPGTKVDARFARQGISEPIAVTFTRAVIHIPSIPYTISFDGKIGYVPLQNFNESTSEDLARALRQLQADGARGFVLDLRGNPGGYLDQALSVSNMFLQRGQEIASVRGREAEQRYMAQNAPLAPTLPMVILTDGYSASASEIVAGALQDHDRALIIGTTTFGKGLVQTVFQLDGGWALKMTTGKWFTPSGRTIQKERKLLPDGQFVETHPDSLESDSLRRARPAYKSDGGRLVFGGGAVTPDLIVKPDTFTVGEQAFVKLIAPKSQDVYVQLYEFALTQKGKVGADFQVTQGWRDSLFRRMTTVGVKVDKPTFDAAQRYVDRLLENRVARFAFGDSTAKRRDLDDDVQLRRAIEILRKGQSQKDVFALGMAAARSSKQ
ncbi:MAG: S41 family peptidase [Gemmatimonadetes bacterium]|nr:S41 family peptidase [Gemmatimonadota bacterium]